MRFLPIALAFLFVACGNPAAIEDAPESFVIRYEIHSTPGCHLNARWFNPESRIAETYSASSSGYIWWWTDDYGAMSGQCLFIENVTDVEDCWVEIYVDGECVAQSTVADSVYVEYVLP